MSRKVPEWIGKTLDTPAPPRVRMRVLEKYNNRCYKSGIEIKPGDKWHLDHLIAIINGGENREKNLAPILEESHKEKTRDDLAIKKKVARLAKKHMGALTNRPKSKIAKRYNKEKGFFQAYNTETGEFI